MNLFQQIERLHLPKDSYVVVAGAVLVAHGLLDWDGDIDLAVSPGVFAGLRGWGGWREQTFAGKPILKLGCYDVGMGFGNWNLSDLQADAELIQGIPFMSLRKLLDWKLRMGRPKDLWHARLIASYLQLRTALDRWADDGGRLPSVSP
jgi:hypothetical protein